jgi:hypothetical protein
MVVAIIATFNMGTCNYLQAQVAARMVVPAGLYAVSAHSQTKVIAYSLDADRDHPGNREPYHLLGDTADVSIRYFTNDVTRPVSFWASGISFYGTGSYREILIKNTSDLPVIINVKKNAQLGNEVESLPIEGAENWTIQGNDFDEMQNAILIMTLQSMLKAGGANIEVNGTVGDDMLEAMNTLLNGKTKWFASDVKYYIKDATLQVRRYTARYRVTAGLDSAKIENFADVQDEINRKQDQSGCYISEIQYDFTTNTASLKLNCANNIGYSFNITPLMENTISFTGKNKDGSALGFGWNEKGEFESFGAKGFRK